VRGARPATRRRAGQRQLGCEDPGPRARKRARADEQGVPRPLLGAWHRRQDAFLGHRRGTGRPRATSGGERRLAPRGAAAGGAPVGDAERRRTPWRVVLHSIIGRRWRQQARPQDRAPCARRPCRQGRRRRRCAPAAPERRRPQAGTERSAARRPAAVGAPGRTAATPAAAPTRSTDAAARRAAAPGPPAAPRDVVGWRSSARPAASARRAQPVAATPPAGRRSCGAAGARGPCPAPARAAAAAAAAPAERGCARLPCAASPAPLGTGSGPSARSRPSPAGGSGPLTGCSRASLGPVRWSPAAGRRSRWCAARLVVGQAHPAAARSAGVVVGQAHPPAPRHGWPRQRRAPAPGSRRCRWWRWRS
jgi:hypothetical protein